MTNNPTLPNYSSDGFGYHYEDGVLVMHNPGSGNLCDPGGLTGWLESIEKNKAEQRKVERAELTKAARKQKADDFAKLGPLYGELAQLIRENMAEAKRPARKPAVLKRHKRRRPLKAD